MIGRPAWHARAACRGTMHDGACDHWPHDEGGARAAVARARTVCDRCPVRAECFDAGVGELSGVWGGLSVSDRRRLRPELDVFLRLREAA